MKIIQKKSLGQNFLQDKTVLSKIVSAGELSVGDNVLEIGPGEGVLTKQLLKNGARVVAIEKDERMKSLNSSLQKIHNRLNSLELYFADIMEINLPKVLAENNFDKNGYKVIANIPYYITGKIIRLLLEQEVLPEIIVLLVQKEVAERIVVKNGRESILSLSVKYYGKAEIVDYVSRKAFKPIPKVDSAILKITPFKNKRGNPMEEERFFRLLKIGFASPRKTLFNNLKNGYHLKKEILQKIFQEKSLPENIRAEKLKLEDWLDLATKFPPAISK